MSVLSDQREMKMNITYYKFDIGEYQQPYSVYDYRNGPFDRINSRGDIKRFHNVGVNEQE